MLNYFLYAFSLGKKIVKVVNFQMDERCSGSILKKVAMAVVTNAFLTEKFCPNNGGIIQPTNL